MTREDVRAFQDPYPELMKDTRMLIVNYDVLRYHSFDLLRYTLFKLALHDVESFGRLRLSYIPIVDESWSLEEKIVYMKRMFRYENIFKGFVDVGPNGDDMKEYEERIEMMFEDPKAIALPTELALDLYPMIDRKDMTVYLLMYPGDIVKPSFYDGCTVYESSNILDMEMAVAIILKHNINAVMVNSNRAAIRIAERLHEEKHNDPMTFIVGDYGYNYEFVEGKRYLPTDRVKMGMLELGRNYEFGTFDPFTRLTRAVRSSNEDRMAKLKEETPDERKSDPE